MVRVQLLEKLRRLEEGVGKKDDKLLILCAIRNEDGTYKHGDELLTKNQLTHRIEENKYKYVIIL